MGASRVVTLDVSDDESSTQSVERSFDEPAKERLQDLSVGFAVRLEAWVSEFQVAVDVLAANPEMLEQSLNAVGSVCFLDPAEGEGRGDEMPAECCAGGAGCLGALRDLGQRAREEL